MSRLRLEEFGAATVGQLLAAYPGSTLPGCSLDGAVTYDGHPTLKYEGALANGPALLHYALPGGTRRLWSSVALRFSSSLYADEEPADGTVGVPFAVTLQTPAGAHSIRSGLYETFEPPLGPNNYHYVAQIDGGLARAGTWYGENALVKGFQLRGEDTDFGSGWHLWRTLIEREDNGLVRARGWFDGGAVLDQRFVEDADIGHWERWTITLDPQLYASGNDLWIGELAWWDAERDPDPYGLVLLWADGFGDGAFTLGQKYEQGADMLVFNDGTGKSGPVYLQVRSRAGFLTKDLALPQHEVGFHLHFMPYQLSGLPWNVGREILGWRSASAMSQAGATFNQNARAGRLVMNADRTLSLQYGTIAAGAAATQYANADHVVTTGWTNPANAYGAADSVFATAAPALNSDITSDFGFASFAGQIPSGAVIDTITVTIHYKSSVASSTGSVLGVQIRNGGANSDDHTLSPTTTASEFSFTITHGIGVMLDIGTPYAEITRSDLAAADQVRVRLRAHRGSGVAITWSLDDVSLVVNWHVPPATVATSPPLPALAPQLYSLADWYHLYVDVGFGPEGEGFVAVKVNGEDFWLAEGVQTAGARGAVMPCVSVGNSDTFERAGRYAYNACNFLLSAGVEFRLAELPWQPPNADLQVNGPFDMQSAHTRHGVNAPTELANTSVDGVARAPAWSDLWSNVSYEDDEDAGMVFTDPDVLPAGQQVVVALAPLTDPDCGGLIAAIVPLLSARRAATLFDYTDYPGDHVAVTDDIAEGTFRLLVRPGEDSTDHYSPLLGGADGTFTALRYRDPFTGLKTYAGDFGFFMQEPHYWPLNPASGDSWEPTALPGIGFQAQACWVWLSTYGAYVIRVRPSDTAVSTPPSIVLPRKNLAFREARLDRALVRKHLAWRPVRGAWVRKDLAWRPLAIGSPALPAYCPDGPQPAPLVEQFSQGRLNTRLWSLVTGIEVCDVTIAAGEIRFTLGGTIGSQTGSEVGLYSNDFYDFTGGSAQIKVTEFIEASPTRFQVFQADPFIFQWSNGFLRVFDNYAFVVLVSLSFAGIAPKWFRVRHDLPAHTFYFEASADGTAWDAIYWTSDLPDDYWSFSYLHIGLYNDGISAGETRGAFAELLTSPVTRA